jgi:hypothetical protein
LTTQIRDQAHSLPWPSVHLSATPFLIGSLNLVPQAIALNMEKWGITFGLGPDFLAASVKPPGNDSNKSLFLI